MKKTPFALLPITLLHLGCPEPAVDADATSMDAFNVSDVSSVSDAFNPSDAFRPQPDAHATPDAFVPVDAFDRCASVSCGTFEQCDATSGACVAACDCPSDGLCDTRSGACVPAGNAASDACASVPMLDAPSRSGGAPLFVQGSFASAMRDFMVSGGIPGTVSCYVESGLVDQVVRIRIPTESTYGFELVTEHATTARARINVMRDAVCTETTSSCSGAGTGLYTPGDYSVIVSGTPAMGRWLLRITRS